MSSTPSFAEMKYQRVPIEQMRARYEDLQHRLKSADAAGIVDVVRDWTLLRSQHQTMSSLNEVQFTIDTRDADAKQERKFLDEQQPTIEEWDTAMRRALLAHAHRAAL